MNLRHHFLSSTSPVLPTNSNNVGGQTNFHSTWSFVGNAQSNANVAMKNNKIAYILVRCGTTRRSMLHLLQITQPTVAHILNSTPLVCERFQGTICSSPKMMFEIVLDALLILCTRLPFPGDCVKRDSSHVITRAISSTGLKFASSNCFLHRRARGLILIKFHI